MEKLKILIIEDLSSDVELIERELKKLNRPFETRVVQDAEALKKAIREFEPDVVLSDYMLPTFSGMEALQIVKEIDPDLPFIIVTGSMNELTAVECMKAGAWDYVIKEKLEKLSPAVESALQRRQLVLQRREALKKLEESEERFRVLVEAAPLAIVVYHDEKIVYANPVTLKLAGAKSRDEIIGQNIFRFVHPDSMELVKTRYEESLKGKTHPPAEEKFVTLDGRTLVVEISSMPIEYQGKRSFMSIINDITDRRQVMERYQTLVEQSNDAIYLLYDGKFEFINKRFTEIFGYTLEECNTPEFNFLNLIAPESIESIKQRMADFARGKKLPDLYEFVALNKQGQRVYCEASVSYVKYKDGYATQGVIRDITRRKQAELEIHKLSQAVEQSPVSIMILDKNGRIEYVNKTFCEKMDLTEEEVLGKEPTILSSEEGSENLFKTIYQQVSQGQVWQGEIKIVKKDGSLLYTKTVVSPIFDTDGNIINFLDMSEDITQQKQLEEQFLQSQKMEAIGRLAGGVAHDFNNLLTVINGYSELLLHKLSPENPLFEPIVQIKEAGRRAASLTSQLLAFSRKQIMQPKILDLNLVIKDMAKMLNRLIGEDINLTILYDETLGLIKADPGQIEQVIMNLVVNARDAMPDGGQLTVKLSNTYLDKNYVNVFSDLNEGWYAEIDITDTGVGMSKEVLSHIFEPFFSTKEKGKGTGLGLATVYGIVKQSGGHVRVYSEEGQGTTFKIYFPIVNEEEIAEESETRLRKNLEGTETILVAEDESSVRELIITGLNNYGYKIITAKNLKEAVKLFEEHEEQIDFLLTDVVMPGGSGAELAEILRKKRNDLKVLFMSGYTDDNIVQRGILPEDVNFIQKPFTVQDLAAKIRQIIDTH